MTHIDQLQQNGIKAFQIGDYDDAKLQFEAMLAAATSADDRQKMAEAMNDLGVVYKELGEIDLALETLDKALKTYQDMDDERGEAITLGNMGKAEEAAGKYEDAIQSYIDSAAIFEELNESQMAMYSWQALSRLKMNNKDWVGAIAAYEEGISHLPNSSIKKKILQTLLKTPYKFLG